MNTTAMLICTEINRVRHEGNQTGGVWGATPLLRQSTPFRRGIAQAIETLKANRHSTVACTHAIELGAINQPIKWQRSHVMLTHPRLLRIASLRVVSMESLKRWARRVVKAPEHEVPTISTKDVFTGYQRNPAPLVRWVRFLKPRNHFLTCPIGR